MKEEKKKGDDKGRSGRKCNEGKENESMERTMTMKKMMTVKGKEDWRRSKRRV